MLQRQQCYNRQQRRLLSDRILFGPDIDPSSPSLSLSFNQSANSQHAPLLSLSAGLGSSPSKHNVAGAGLGIGNLPSPSAREPGNPLAHSQSSSLFNNGQHNHQRFLWQEKLARLALNSFPIRPFVLIFSRRRNDPFWSAQTRARHELARFCHRFPGSLSKSKHVGREITPFISTKRTAQTTKPITQRHSSSATKQR